MSKMSTTLFINQVHQESTMFDHDTDRGHPIGRMVVLP